MRRLVRPHAPIVIPALRLISNSSEISSVIEDGLINFFSGRDLFEYSSPLRTENYFFGREDIINELMQAKYTYQNCGIFGLRKIGKTSILYSYMNRE